LTKNFLQPQAGVGGVCNSCPEEKLIQRANRMFDFIERYPKLIPQNVRGTRVSRAIYP